MSPQKEYHWTAINHEEQKSVDWTSKKVNTAVIFLLRWPLNLFISAHINWVVLWSFLGLSPKFLCFSTTGLNSWLLMASAESSNITMCCNKPIVKTIMRINFYMAFAWYQKERISEKQKTYSHTDILLFWLHLGESRWEIPKDPHKVGNEIYI